VGGDRAGDAGQRDGEGEPAARDGGDHAAHRGGDHPAALGHRHTHHHHQHEEPEDDAESALTAGERPGNMKALVLPHERLLRYRPGPATRGRADLEVTAAALLARSAYRHGRDLPARRRSIAVTTIDFQGSTPEVSESAWVAPNATLIGRVSLAGSASVFYS